MARKAWQVQTTPTIKLVLLALADHADGNGRCWPAVATLVKKTGLSRASVLRSIDELKKLSLISVGKNKGRSSAYRLFPRELLPTGGITEIQVSQRDTCHSATRVVSQCDKGGITETPAYIYNDMLTINNHQLTLNNISAQYQTACDCVAVSVVAEPAETSTAIQATTKKTKQNQRDAELKNRKTGIPAGFCVSDSVRKWAAEKGYDRLDERLESFVLVAKSKGYKYINWDAAFMRAVRDDWARLNGRPGGKTNGKPAAFMSVSGQDFGDDYVTNM